MGTELQHEVATDSFRDMPAQRKPIAPPLGDRRRYSWEPVILSPVRVPLHSTPTAIAVSPPQFTFRTTPESHVIGEKPEDFAHWVFASAGLLKTDDLVDLFPGSGAISRAWETYDPARGKNPINQMMLDL